MGFFFTSSALAEKEGIILKQDENIYINNYNFYSMLGGTEDLGYSAQSVIFGDIVNISEDDLFYVVLRANIYDDNELLLTELEFPTKIHLRSGESTSFSMFPELGGWDCFELWVEDYKFENESDVLDGKEIRKSIKDSLEVTMKDSRGQLKIKVKNIDSSPVYGTSINVIKYDKDNNIIGMFWDGSTIDQKGHLNAGDTITFDVTAYLAGYPIQSDLEKYLYEKPDRIEIEVYGLSWDGGDVDEWTSLTGKVTDEKWIKAYQLFTYDAFVGNNLSGGIVGEHIDIPSIQNSISSEIKNPSKRGYCTSQEITQPEITTSSIIIPNWIKLNAGWWSSGDIDDNAFLTGIAYMVSNKIIDIPEVEKTNSDYDKAINDDLEQTIPSWIKSNAEWWSDGIISDDDFAKGIQFLIKNGIIRVD